MGIFAIYLTIAAVCLVYCMTARRGQGTFMSSLLTSLIWPITAVFLLVTFIMGIINYDRWK